jgi:hypothetical protein
MIVITSLGMLIARRQLSTFKRRGEVKHRDLRGDFQQPTHTLVKMTPAPLCSNPTMGTSSDQARELSYPIFFLTFQKFRILDNL